MKSVVLFDNLDYFDSIQLCPANNGDPEEHSLNVKVIEGVGLKYSELEVDSDVYSKVLLKKAKDSVTLCTKSVNFGFDAKWYFEHSFNYEGLPAFSKESDYFTNRGCPTEFSYSKVMLTVGVSEQELLQNFAK